MMNVSQRIKEYFNLNGYYLRLSLTNELLVLTSFNSELLDGIKYETLINADVIKKNDRIRNLTVISLYELIVNKIKEKKIMIKVSNYSITLLLLDSMTINLNKDIQICLVRNNKYYANEYESVLASVITNLKEENKNIRNEINEIKNLLKIGNINILNNVSNNNIISNPSINVLKKTATTLNTKSNINLNMNQSQSPKIIDNGKSINLPNQFQKSMQAADNPKNSILNTGSDPMHNSLPKPSLGPNNLQTNENNNNNINNNKNIANLNIAELANMNFPDYPKVQISQNSVGKVMAYAVNSYHGISKNYNEDKTKIILDYKHNKPINDVNGKITNPTISYFGIYDGHGGNKCSDFLQEKFDSFLFNSNYFPLYTLQAINDAFLKAEKEFESVSFDAQNKVMLDKSGSCVLSVLIVNDWCFVSYLGDSRGLYSFDSGNQLFQITRDHKPNDPIEKDRIEKSGGKIYKDTRLKINGHKVHVNEQSVPGVQFPFRVMPGNLAVSQKILFNIK